MGTHGLSRLLRAEIMVFMFTVLLFGCDSSGSSSDDPSGGTAYIPNKIMVKLPSSAGRSASSSSKRVLNPAIPQEIPQHWHDVFKGWMHDVRIMMADESAAVVEINELLGQNDLAPSDVLQKEKSFTITAALTEKFVQMMKSQGCEDPEEEAKLRDMEGNTITWEDFIYTTSSDPAYDYNLSYAEYPSGRSANMYWTKEGKTKVQDSGPMDVYSESEFVASYDDVLKASGFMLYRRHTNGILYAYWIKVREDIGSGKSGIYFSGRYADKGDGTADGKGGTMIGYADEDGGALMADYNNGAVKISCSFDTVKVTDETSLGTYEAKVNEAKDKLAEVLDLVSIYE